MSFILDALKKSERERELQAQGSQPGIVYRQSHSQPVWMIVVITLLLANMVLVTVIWLRGSHQQSVPTITVNNSTPAAVQNPATVPAAVSATNEVRTLQNEPQPQDETAALLAKAPLPNNPQLVRQITPDDAAKSGSNSMITNYPKSVGASIPTLDSIGGNAALNLPALHLDVHVYSINAAERFVFINMKKYAEGQVLKEGPVLEHITQDGAVLKQGEQQFLLPRQ